MSSYKYRAITASSDAAVSKREASRDAALCVRSVQWEGRRYNEITLGGDGVGFKLCI